MSVKKNTFTFFILMIFFYLQGCTFNKASDIEGTTKFSAMTITNNDYFYHSVKSGDTLWSIAYEYYKNPFLWPSIYRQNAQSIYDADLILPGQSLIIHEEISNMERQLAVKHAKNRGLWVVGYKEESDVDYLESN